MKILVVAGSCLRVNSSANLCHLAYIRGLAENGHQVQVLSVAEKGQVIDKSIVLPQGVQYRTFADTFLYRFMRPSSWKRTKNNLQNQRKNWKTKIIRCLRNAVNSFYGPLGLHGAWAKNAVRGFGPCQYYDVVISLSSPVHSHWAAVQLIKKGKVRCKKHVEIWEDPWYLDLYNRQKNEQQYSMEKELLFACDRVFYVSPLTLKYQRELFADSADKMAWVPLPYYYKESQPAAANNRFGYFGDYFPFSRDLTPFYQAAKQCNISVCICGSPESLFAPTENISIYPRLDLADLKQREQDAGIWVCLANKKGGQIPGKIYQYAATYKKVLFVLDGTADEQEALRCFFEPFGRFYFCSNNVADIKRAIEEILAGNKPIKNEPLEFFSPSNIVRQILSKAELL